MRKFLGEVFVGVGIVGFVILLSFLLAWPVMILWNACLVPATSGLHEVTWSQAWGISLLCGLLVKSSTNFKKG